MNPLLVALIPAVLVLVGEILRDYLNHRQARTARFDAIEARLTAIETRISVLR